MISIYHKDYPEKLITTSLPINSTPPIANLTAKPISKSLNTVKRECDQQVKVYVKQTREV